jgi:hypothetical protein
MHLLSRVQAGKCPIVLADLPENRVEKPAAKQAQKLELFRIVSYDFHQTPENQLMNDYEVTYANGEIAVVTAWTPEAALVIAEEESELNGCPGVEPVTVNLLAAHPAEI